MNGLKKKFLIVANGEWNVRVVSHFILDRKIVALDGAAEKFHAHSLAPNYILGDFDSITEKRGNGDYFNREAAMRYFDLAPLPSDDEVKFEEYRTHIKTLQDEVRPVAYIRTSSQKYTDLEKGIQFCLAHQKGRELLDIIILGAFGGDRIDHFLNNFLVLKKYRHAGVSIKMANELQIVEYLEDESRIFEGNIGEKFGVFGFPWAVISSNGLKWDLKDFALEYGEENSACNELREDQVEVTVKGKAIIIRPNDFLKFSAIFEKL